MKYLPLLFLIAVASCGKSPQKKDPVIQNSVADSISSTADSLRSLDIKLGQPQPGDWLYNNNEKGQTFSQFQTFAPIKPDSARTIFYLQPIGNFNQFESGVFKDLSQYLNYYYQFPVKLLEPISNETINNNAIRFSSTGDHQVLTHYILDSILSPRLPKNAFMMMAITNMDLYTGPHNNFVFGHATFKKRVAVSSFQRFAYDSTHTLQRIMKTAAHETGHMLGIKHCTYAQCLMNGSNSLVELDLRPFHLCSQCLKKLEWSLQLDLPNRFMMLESFYQDQDIKDEANFMHKSLEKFGPVQN
jgi:archaemetzincin